MALDTRKLHDINETYGRAAGDLVDTDIPVSLRYALTRLDTAVPDRDMMTTLTWTL